MRNTTTFQPALFCKECRLTLSSRNELPIYYACEYPSVRIVFNPQHEWLMTSHDMCAGYGITQSDFAAIKARNAADLIKGLHWVMDAPAGRILWTKAGVLRFGFFVKGARAKRFRAWSEQDASMPFLKSEGGSHA